ncbi:MAG: SPOR domain-containing protein [Ignavibacteriae bacterium]|nr:SPOR domain-containing protein [Ignavibacteriota bacterium]
MNKDELVIKLAEEFGISTIDIYQLVNSVIDSMSNALRKGKAINISEFGKFKIISRKKGEDIYKTVSFSPVKKFAFEVNSKYNNLSPTILRPSTDKDDETSGINKKAPFKRDIEYKILPENINPRVMENKDKYDRSIIRDDLSQDSSSNEINDFIKSKLENPEGEHISGEKDMKNFELPHSLIELHKDITSEEKIEDILPSPDQLPEIDQLASIERLINERKKALEQLTPEHQTEERDESTSMQEHDIKDFAIDDRDKLEEFKTFEDERNAELSKIIAERNKIIEDINLMVEQVDEIPAIKEIHIDEKPILEEKHAEDEKPLEEMTVDKLEPAPEIQQEDMTLKEDKSEETKFQYDETELLHENFDPIASDDDINKDTDYTKNDILIPEDVEELKSGILETGNDAKSFEDIFEAKTDPFPDKKEVEKPTQIREEKKLIEPPVSKIPELKTPQPSPILSQSPSYIKKEQEREQMYKEKSEKSRKKGYWIGGAIVAFLILMVYLASNTGSFTPPPESKNDQVNTEQQNTPPQNSEQKSEQQNQTSKENIPPVTTNQEQNTEKAPETKDEKTQQTPPAQEEVTFDKTLNVAFVNAPDGIYIQTASFKTKSDADKSASKISAGNKKVSVVQADLGEKGTYYRVRIGKFASMEEAREFAGKLKK